MEIKAWEIWMACVRFEESEETKVRPVLITHNGEAFVVGYKVTGHTPRNMWGEYSIKNWQAAGLSKPSTVRFSKMLQIPQADVIRKIGTLQGLDKVAVIRMLKSRR